MVVLFRTLEGNVHMLLSGPKQVFNFDDIFPSDGESRFELSFLDGILKLDIFYEIEGAEVSEARCEIRFSHAKYFLKSPFPGYSFFNCPDDRDLSLLSSLVEYQYSDMLNMELERSGAKDYNHYRLFLHSSGVAIHVIATSYEILDVSLDI